MVEKKSCPVRVTSSDRWWTPSTNTLAFATSANGWGCHVLAWRLSNTLNSKFCIDALEEAFDTARALPTIFNSDQGSQSGTAEVVIPSAMLHTVKP